MFTQRSIVTILEESRVDRLIKLSQNLRLEEEVGRDFSRARRKALLKWLWAWLQNDLASHQLPSFDEARRSRMAHNHVYLGRKAVEVAKIVGSIGHRRDFDRTFLPTTSSVRKKWKLADKAFRRDGELPSVSLYKIGGKYFVWDGNHHVSVARFRSVEMIDADVTELRILALHWRHL